MIAIAGWAIAIIHCLMKNGEFLEKLLLVHKKWF